MLSAQKHKRSDCARQPNTDPQPQVPWGSCPTKQQHMQQPQIWNSTTKTARQRQACGANTCSINCGNKTCPPGRLLAPYDLAILHASGLAVLRACAPLSVCLFACLLAHMRPCVPVCLSSCMLCACCRVSSHARMSAHCSHNCARARAYVSARVRGRGRRGGRPSAAGHGGPAEGLEAWTGTAQGPH